MKKMISFILAAALTAVAAMPAFAADTVSNGDGTWTTSGSDASYAGKMMTMVAYDASEGITVDSIQYIDQTTADENGAFSFDNYIPKTVSTTSDYTVLVGGETLAAPIAGGTIEKVTPPAPTEFAVTGTVTTTNNLEAVNVAVYTADTTELKASDDSLDGAIDLTIVPGTYDIVITRPGFLKYTIKAVTVADAAVALGNVALVAGDMNADEVVNTDDLSEILSVFGAGTDAEGYEIKLNINGDNVINTDDLSEVLSAFGDVATTVTFGA